MGFEIILVNAPPVSDMEDPREAQATFFAQIGYFTPGYDPRTDARNIFESVPFRIFSDYFLKQPAAPHKVEDMASRLKTTVATIYRHLNKIKKLDILDEVELGRGDGYKVSKGYRLRYGALPDAWRFAETDMAVCLENYRKLVDGVVEIHGRTDSRGKGGKSSEEAGEVDEPAQGGARSRGKAGQAFRLKLVDALVDPDDQEDYDLLFLTSVDYLSPRGIAGKSKKEIRKGIGYRLFMECFMERSDRLWSYDELCTVLDTTFPTVSRYINKLKSIDVLEEVLVDRGQDEMPIKGFRLRHGDLTKAWNVTEAQARASLRNYRRSVDHLGQLKGTK